MGSRTKNVCIQTNMLFPGLSISHYRTDSILWLTTEDRRCYQCHSDCGSPGREQKPRLVDFLPSRREGDSSQRRVRWPNLEPPAGTWGGVLRCHPSAQCELDHRAAVRTWSCDWQWCRWPPQRFHRRVAALWSISLDPRLPSQRRQWLQQFLRRTLSRKATRTSSGL